MKIIVKNKKGKKFQVTVADYVNQIPVVVSPTAPFGFGMNLANGSVSGSGT